MFFTGCLSVHRGRCTPPWADSPLGRHLPGQTPPDEPLLGRHPSGQTPLLPETATAADGMHSTGIHSCFQECLLLHI